MQNEIQLSFDRIYYLLTAKSIEEYGYMPGLSRKIGGLGRHQRNNRLRPQMVTLVGQSRPWLMINEI